MNILLIGGCGYIGSRLYSVLAEKHFVNTVDIEWFGGGSLNICADYNDLEEGFIKKYDVVILLAGHSSVQMCKDNPQACYTNNVSNFINLIEKIGKGTKFIYASSSSVYGNFKSELATEKDLDFEPNNFYDLSKHTIDLHASLYSTEYYGLRFGTVNGFSQNFRKDIMINAMYASYDKHGYISEYNPQVYRPILDIQDLARAIETIIEKGSPEKAGIYNLSSFNLTVGEIVGYVSKYLNCPVVKKNGTDNTKLQSGLYDFSISSEKFSKVFDFQFGGGVGTILDDIISHSKDIIFTDRNIKKEYV